MPLSAPSSPRIHKHTRAIAVAAYLREDGLWEFDASLSDTKTRVVKLASGARPAGAAIHDLGLRITVNTEFTIVDAEATSDAVPYPGYCDTIAPDYRKLIGLNLMRGFRLGLKERLSGTAGCTHLTELAQILPTAVVQAFSGDVLDTRDGGDNEAAAFTTEQAEKPFQLDRCHALQSAGPAVAKFYPRWAINSTSKSESS